MRAVGIDLGTRNARIAYVDAGVPRLLETQGGATELPSAVSFVQRAPVFGRDALARAITHSDTTVQSVKRLLGRPRTHASVAEIAGRAGFPISVSGARVMLGLAGALRPPESIVASIFEHLTYLVTERIGERPGRAVIAVPVWFAEPERRALLDAATRAGFADAELVFDTTALALAVPAADAATRCVAAIDAGAGGTSAAIYAVTGGEVQLVASASDEGAGGDAADELLAAIALAEMERTGVVVRDPPTREMLRQSIEAMKRAVAANGSSTVPVELDRARMESTIASVLDRIEACAKSALDAAKLRAADVDVVRAGGGMAELEMVRARIERAFAGARGLVERAPIGAAALGAVRLGATLTGELAPVAVRELPAPYPSRAPAAAASTTNPGAAGPPMWSPELYPAPGPHANASPFAATIPGSSGFNVAAFASTSPGTTWPGAARPADAWTGPPPPRMPPPRMDTPAISGAPVTPIPKAMTPAPAPLPIPPAMPPSGPTDDIGQIPPSTADLAFTRSGKFQNPTTAKALLDLALTRKVTARDLDPVALPVLLFTILGRQKRSGTVTITSADKSAVVCVARGAAILKKAEQTALIAAFRWPNGQYSYSSDMPSDMANRQKHSMIRLTIEGLRTISRGIPEDELREALADRLDFAPAVPADLQPDLDRMALQPNELRIARHSFDGKVALRDLLSQSGGGRHTTLQLVALLSLFNYLDWNKVAAAPKLSFADELALRAKAIEKAANHFEALGIHWSATSSDVDLAYRKVRAEHERNSLAHRASPEACERICARADAAYAVLRDERLRHVHRRETFPDVDFSAVSDILSGTIDTMELRGDSRGMASMMTTKRELERTNLSKRTGDGAANPATTGGGAGGSGGAGASGGAGGGTGDLGPRSRSAKKP